MKSVYTVSFCRQEPSKAKKVRKKYVLSFDHSDHSDDDSSPSTKLPTSALNDKTKSAPLTLLKNPDVDTSFLPDREREEAERLEKEQLRLEWIKKQAEMKEEDICIGYSYWDGEGHRAEVVVSQVLNESVQLTSGPSVRKGIRSAHF